MRINEEGEAIIDMIQFAFSSQMIRGKYRIVHKIDET